MINLNYKQKEYIFIAIKSINAFVSYSVVEVYNDGSIYSRNYHILLARRLDVYDLYKSLEKIPKDKRFKYANNLLNNLEIIKKFKL